MSDNNKIKVFKTVKAAYANAFATILPALGMSAFVAISGLILMTALLYVVPSSDTLLKVYLGSFYGLLFFGFSSAAYMALSKIFGLNVSFKPWVLWRSSRYWKFIASSMLLGVAILGSFALGFSSIFFGWGEIMGINVALPLQKEGITLLGMSAVGGVGLAGVVGLRMFMFLPNVAATGRVSPSTSWRLTKGRVGTVWGCYLVGTIPMSILQTSLNYPGFGTNGPTLQSIVTVAAFIVGMMQCIIIGSIGGTIYKQIEADPKAGLVSR